MGLFRGHTIVLRRVRRPLIKRGKVEQASGDRFDWSRYHCSVIIGRADKLTERSLARVIEAIVNRLATKQALFSGRFAGTTATGLEEAQNELLRAGARVEVDLRESMGVYAPIAGELRYETEHPRSIAPLWSHWDSADYFDLVHVDETCVAAVKGLMQEDALRYSEFSLAELARLGKFLVRKSGDEDEVEIISAAISFSTVHTVLWEVLEFAARASEVTIELQPSGTEDHT